ncbi:MAG: DUF4258 domain-containing protein [Candidatus Thermoplasmatota archaeon]|nr:DUF4258 domain-containing protein [Candidatus Thermoplasmatota archaeon]
MKIEQIKEKVRKGKYYISFTHTEKLRKRRINTGEIEEAISRGEIIEDYPYDVRGASCLILGFTFKGKPLHIVCGRVGEEIIIITVYEPSLSEWQEDLKIRR